MKQQTTEKEYARILKRVCILCWFERTLDMPLQLLTAGLSAALVTNAVEGDVAAVGRMGCAVLAVVVGGRLLSAVLHTVTEELREKGLHQCRVETYRRFLSMPLSGLYDSGQGEISERFRDDFSTVTNKICRDIPQLWATGMALAVYFAVLFTKEPLLAVLFLALAMVQLLPPMVVKNFLSRNYKDCREIEEEITNLTVEGYRGFSTIKMYGLKQWYLDRMEKLHKIYRRVGLHSSAAGAAEVSLDQLAEYVLKYGAGILAGVFVLYGAIDTEAGVYAIMLSSGLFGAVKGIFSAIPSFAVAREAGKRLAEWDREEKRLPACSSEGLADYQVSLEGIVCSRQEHSIFRQMNCKLDMRKINVIKGENGAGKSTLLKLLAGLIVAQEGRIRTGEAARQFFYLPQERNGMDITGEELLELMSLKGNREAEILRKEFQVGDALLGQKLDALSGGEEKRLFLVAGLADADRLLLLDEPTNSLDRPGREKLVHFLQARKGGAVIVTHEELFDGIADCIYTVAEGGIRLAEG